MEQTLPADAQPAPTDTKSRKKSPRAQARFWAKEIEQSEKFLRHFQKQGTKVVQRFLDDRGQGFTSGLNIDDGAFRLNLFNSNTRTLQDMLYSNLPKVEASRTHGDANDDVARVAAETMERLINVDIADHPKDYDSVLRSCLQDRLLPGLACARVRYTFRKETINVPAQTDQQGNVIVPAQITTRIVDEKAPIDYVHWQDVLWGWARCYSEVPWVAYRSYMSKDEVKERFGGAAADNVQYTKRKAADGDDDESRPEDDSPWKQAEIWEIWDKPTKTVYWFSPGYTKILDSKPDPLQLRHFFPSPEFMMANATTTLYRPVSDFHMCQDLYNEVDTLSTRISILTTAVKAVGVYAADNDGVKRMFKEGFENDLIPVDDWAMFAESGGLQGVIDWLPIMDVVNALDKLRDLREETISLLQRVSGMADVMQGGLQNQYEGVGQTQIKAQFGSARIQALQDCFAQFAADLLQLKAEVICKHFQPQSIANMSNMSYSMDADMLEQAIQLLKQPQMAHLRIVVRPEQVAMVDYARLKVERTEFLNAMATFMQSAGPLLEMNQAAMPTLLKMLQWTLSGFKGSAQIEGVLDDAIEQAEQQAQEPQEDPAAAAAAAEAEAAQQAHANEMEKEQFKLNADLQKIKAKGESDMAVRNNDLQADIQTHRSQSSAKLEEILAAHQANMRESKAKMHADVMTARVEGQMNIQQTITDAETEMMKDEHQSALNIEEEIDKAELAIDQEAASLEAEIRKRDNDLGAKLREIRAQTQQQRKNSDDES